MLEGLIPKRDDKGTLTTPHLEKLFIFSVMWSLGALLELDDRAKMEEFMLKHDCGLNFPPTKEDETIFEYLVDEKGKHYNVANLYDQVPAHYVFYRSKYIL